MGNASDRHPWSAFLLARTHYQYVFGAALWVVWLGLLLHNGSIYTPDGFLFGIDYVAFYSAGTLVLQHQGEYLFDFEAVRRLQQELFGLEPGRMMAYMNPPFYALLMAPFALLPFLPSLLAWNLVTLGLYGVGLVGLEGKLRWGTLAAVLCFFPAFFTFRNGQNTFFTAALFGIVYGFMRKERPFAAGLTASLLLYKPHMILGVAFLWLVQARRWWRALLGLAVGSLLTLGVTEVFLPGSLVAYAEMSRTKLAEWIYQPNYPVQIQYTIRGLVLTLFPGARPVAEVAQIVTLLGGLVCLWAFCRRQPALPLCYAAAIAIGVCASPHLLLYDWAILTVPAILLWHAAPAERGFWIWPFATLWLIAPLGRALVEAQLEIFGVALHVPYLVLVGTTVLTLTRAARLNLSPSPLLQGEGQ